MTRKGKEDIEWIDYNFEILLTYNFIPKICILLPVSAQ